MGGTDEKAYKYYRKYMKRMDDCFSIVKTAHTSKWDDLQLMTYQMDNSIPTTDKGVLEHITDCSVNYCNRMKTDEKAYLEYLDKRKGNYNINELLLELTKWNPEFLKTEFYRTKKTKDISRLKNKYFKQGRLLQNADNLTIMDNPVALLIKAVGGDPLQEECFKVMKDGVQCHTTRFKEGERLAAFRSPHNSPNNIIHLYNVYPDKLRRYFPNIGQNVIIFNAIKTDTQARLSGHDVDSDFVFVTNQSDLADLARRAYVQYPTIINEVEELSTSGYHFLLEDYAKMDNKIADAQESIGTSTDVAQLALSYYYDGNMESPELEECFIILSVIGQISIDLAKKSFDINVVKEINRIRNLPCMKRIKYAGRESHVPLRNFLNHDVIGKGNKYKKDKVISEAKEYNRTEKWIEKNREQMDDSTYFSLKNNAMSQFLNKASKNLDQETIMQLVIYAVKDENSDISTTVLNFLFRNYKEEFMNCFTKKRSKIDELFSQNAQKAI